MPNLYNNRPIFADSAPQKGIKPNLSNCKTSCTLKNWPFPRGVVPDKPPILRDAAVAGVHCQVCQRLVVRMPLDYNPKRQQMDLLVVDDLPFPGGMPRSLKCSCRKQCTTWRLKKRIPWKVPPLIQKSSLLGCRYRVPGGPSHKSMLGLGPGRNRSK